MFIQLNYVSVVGSPRPCVLALDSIESIAGLKDSNYGSNYGSRVTMKSGKQHEVSESVARIIELIEEE